MRISRRRDCKLERLRHLTGLRRHDDLLELGRIVDEVLDDVLGDELYADTFGVGHAIAVVRGAAYRPATGVTYGTGDVFVTRPFERVESLGAVALVAPRSAAGRLAAVMAPLRAVPSRGQVRSRDRQPGRRTTTTQRPAGQGGPPTGRFTFIVRLVPEGEMSDSPASGKRAAHR